MTAPLIPFSFVRSHCPDDLRVPERVRALECEWGRKWTPQDVWEGFLMLWLTMGEHPRFVQGWYERVMGWEFAEVVSGNGRYFKVTTPNSRKAERVPYLVTAWGCSCPATVELCRHRLCYALMTGQVLLEEREEG